MTKDLKDKWLKALRSGEYLQCDSKLKNTNLHYNTCGYCCLGVLLDQFDNSKWFNSNPDYYNIDGINFSGRLGKDFKGNKNTKLLDILGLKMSEELHLIKLNDNISYSFAMIADWIEVNIKEEDA